MRLRPDEFERSILVTLGLSIIIIHVMQYLFTATPRMVDSQYGFDGVEIGAIRITWTRVIGAGAAIGGLRRALCSCCAYTQFGRAMRAIAQNREAALMVGIRPRVVARNAVILAAGLCGLAGAAISPDPARHALHGPVPDLQGVRAGHHRRAGQHPGRGRGRRSASA